MALRIMITAGEASGDRLGAGLARALRERLRDVEIFGMGGEQMAAAGVRLVQDAGEISVVGLVEVLRHLPALRRAMARLAALLQDERPDLLVPIDYPDFNLRLAGRAAESGVPVVYYVSPQVWAWRPGRVRGIGRRVRRILVLFPFEVAIYENAGIPVTCVGYPGDSPRPADPAALRRRIGLDPESRVVALLPGSRRGEAARQLPPMLDAAELLGRRFRDLQWVIPLAPGLDPDWMAGLVHPRLPGARIHAGDYPELLHLSTAGVVAAGTASLDAALAGLPAAVVYRTNSLTYLIGKRLIQVQDVALPNLIAGRRVLPELIQHAYTGAAVAHAIGAWLDDPAEAARVREGLRAVRERLGGAEAFQRAADAVVAELRALGRLG